MDASPRICGMAGIKALPSSSPPMVDQNARCPKIKMRSSIHVGSSLSTEQLPPSGDRRYLSSSYSFRRHPGASNTTSGETPLLLSIHLSSCRFVSKRSFFFCREQSENLPGLQNLDISTAQQATGKGLCGQLPTLFCHSLTLV